jgi:hypothetical protein
VNESEEIENRKTRNLNYNLITKTVNEIKLEIANEWFGFKQTTFNKKGKYYSTLPLNFYINIFAKESSRSDWGSNLRPTATPPSTKYQRSNPLSQIAILI